MSWSFEWRKTWSEVWDEKFQNHWSDILEADSQSQIYHRPQLLRAWSETIAATMCIEPMVGLAIDDLGRRVLLPWVLVNYPGRHLKRRVLEPAGQSLYGYHDPVVAGPNTHSIDWAEFWKNVRRQTRGYCDQALFRFVHARYAGEQWMERCSEQSPVLSLSGLSDLETALARCSLSHRGDVHRQLRRLSDVGDVTLWVAGSEEVPAVLAELHDRFLPAYGAIWRSQRSGSMFDRPGAINFVERIVSDGLPAGWVHYAALRIAGKPIAWHLGLIDRGALYWWIPTYDLQWENFSPGKVLLAKLIQHGIGRRWNRINFLTGGHRYKLNWKPAIEDLRTIRWHAPTLRGSLLAWYDARQTRRCVIKENQT